MKITKAVPSWQWERMCGWPPSVKPQSLKWVDGNLSYDWVAGVHPTNGAEMHRFMVQALWGSLLPNCMELDRTAYVSYVTDRARQATTVTGDKFFNRDDMRRIMRALEFVIDDELTCVSDYHGDCTNHNVLKTPSGRMILIDPGEARGLPCREIDEAKMLQSYEGFCEMYRGTPRLRWTVSPSRIQLVLLMSHYIRLLHHIYDDRCVAFAVRRIESISRLWPL